MAVSRSYAQSRNETIEDQMLDHELSEEEDAVIQEINSELLEALDGYPTRESLISLSYVLCEVICMSAPSLGSAMSASAAISLAVLQSIAECNKVGLCNWNEKPNLQ